jgi:ferric-dicitrate binding protein FerR (iron transport regulator)
VDKSNLLDLIINYLSGEFSEEDERKLNDLIKSESEVKNYYDQIKTIWETDAKSFPKPDLEKAWLKVKDKIENVNLDSDRINPLDKQFRLSSWWFDSKLLRIAAVFLIMIISIYMLIQFYNNSNYKLNEIIVANTKMEKLTLPDGTQLTLDAGSSFLYPMQFVDDKREVYLDGEGYFDVTPNTKNPFIIKTNDAVIQVIGTKFNVRAWKESNKITVAVTEGKVSFKPKNINDPQAEVKISNSQVSEMKKNGFPTLPRETDINIHLAWINREMYFQSVPLKEVLDQLERWYNLKFELPNNSFALNRVTVFIENKKIEEILDVIALMNNLRYKKDGFKFIFYQEN